MSDGGMLEYNRELHRRDKLSIMRTMQGGTLEFLGRQFNPAMLRIALGLRGLEPDARDLEIMCGAQPKPEELGELTDDLGFPVAFFYQPGEYIELPDYKQRKFTGCPTCGHKDKP